MLKKVLFLVVCAVFFSTPQAVSFQGRILGGQDAKEGQFPYQVSLHRLVGPTCGATIISKRFAITAGHCVCPTRSKDP